jgi:uncharacterized membrane protein YedE/YeeE
MLANSVLPAVLGGILIGVSAGALMLGRGRIAGVGGMLGGLASAPREDTWHRAAFLVGLVIAGLIAGVAHAKTLGGSPLSIPALVIGGLLVGYGGQRAAGCTSGHGVCGLARFAPRSLVAVLTFMATGAVTVWVMR